ncbi:PREDICTED: lysosome-associated membrane glycoprotein 1-like [Amphimedon queenslandica]|uniref:Lysosome-associated membrane glycoprotein 2-like transmembrane domain-containing protein n=1 Tax=Amphimedon queenslandica TaxID=400682 RepID=A0A1X7VS37_AMPQE|nr:PREDICTED: lysosome-associated membrane glycoprotein 1-like [Amphimedon queenslandica]|eukprot:XP_011407957.1 PREDICTED: lysosome-associated membrane glycoprotein 1-like [Amphimedon queenslandica]
MSLLFSLVLLSLAGLAFCSHHYDPNNCNFTLSTKDGTTCAYINVKLSLNSTSDPEGNYTIDCKQHNFTTNGSCYNHTAHFNQTIFDFSFEWKDASDNRFNGSASINFTAYDNFKAWNVSNWAVDGDLPVSDKTDELVSCSIGDRLFQYTYGLDTFKSYTCNSSLSYTNSCNVSDLFVVISDLRIQAFKFNANYTFDTAYRCDADIKGSKYIPIIVGGALVGLVLVVFAAYIVGRIRNHKRSQYQPIS